MQLLSTKLKFVSLSSTAKIHNLVLKKQNLGEQVLNLSVGEPDFNTPDHILKAAQSALIDGHIKYTPTNGLDQLKAAIKEKFKKENGLCYDPNEIIVSAGGKQVIFNAFTATLNKGDEVIIPSPYWVSYPDIVRLCQGKPKIIETTIENKFKFSIKHLEQLLNEKTKWLVINSPSNPTGSLYTENELLNIANLLKRFPEVNVMTDDIYEHITFDNVPFCNIVQIDPSLKNRTLVVNGVSKAYAMTGWRIGYGAANSNLIRAMTIVQSQSTSNACTISQFAAIKALQGSQKFLNRNKLIYQNRRDIMLKILSKCNYIEIMSPMGSFYALPSIQKIIGKRTDKGELIQSDTDFVFELLRQTGVAVVPGSAFGAKNTIRISFAISESLLEKACNLIVKFISSLK